MTVCRRRLTFLEMSVHVLWLGYNIAGLKNKYHKSKSRNHESLSILAFNIHHQPPDSYLYVCTMKRLCGGFFNIYLTYFHTTQRRRLKRNSKKKHKKKTFLYLKLKKRKNNCLFKNMQSYYTRETEEEKSEATHLVTRWYQRCKEV